MNHQVTSLTAAFKNVDAFGIANATDFPAASMGGQQFALKASAIKGNSEEERKERKRHTDEAVTNIKVAGFAAAVLYPLHKLIKKLIK